MLPANSPSDSGRFALPSSLHYEGPRRLIGGAGGLCQRMGPSALPPLFSAVLGNFGGAFPPPNPLGMLVIARLRSCSLRFSIFLRSNPRRPAHGPVAGGVRSSSDFAADGPATTQSNQFATPCSSTLGDDDNDVAASARIPWHRILPGRGASALCRASRAPTRSHNVFARHHSEVSMLSSPPSSPPSSPRSSASSIDG